MRRNTPVLLAVLAAALYALNSPLSKLLLSEADPMMMAGLLYSGAGIGMLIIRICGRNTALLKKEKPLTKKDLPYTAGMVILDTAAPILMMYGLKMTDSASASLLNNFEIVATALIALLVFRERISKRLWAAIVLITAASIMLSSEGIESLDFSIGSVLVLLACTCWGLENNCTRMISGSSPFEIVIIKGFGAGASSLVLALATGKAIPAADTIIAALVLGFASYGLSVFFYVYAQRWLGAARTSAWYAVSPFIGAALSFLIFRTPLTGTYLAALAVMIAGSVLAAG